MIEELWVPVVGFEGLYSVSDLGRVRSEARRVPFRGSTRGVRARILRHTPDRHEYPSVFLCKDGIKHCRKVHAIVLEAFVGPCPTGMEGCHEDGDPANPRLDNLRWDTRKGNMADARRHGTISCGSKRHNAKLTDDDVVEIRRLWASGVQGRAIADRFGIARSNVSLICSRKTWKHIITHNTSTETP